MKGHEGIIALRQQKLKPRIVFLNDMPCQTDWFAEKDHATISLSDQDTPETLDLRFLVGVAVSVSSHSEGRAKRLYEACKRAGASSVVAVHVTEEVYHSQSGWLEAYHRG